MTFDGESERREEEELRLTNQNDLPQVGAATQRKSRIKNGRVVPSRGNSGSSSSRLFRWFRLAHVRIDSSSNLLDFVLDKGQSMVEGLIFLLGPVLIILALSIAFLLTWTFAIVLLPMIWQKHGGYDGWIIAFCHCAFVAFILINVLFNYYKCVTTLNYGPSYDVVVRELAKISQFHSFPETKEQIESYRQDYEDKMVLRIQRRRERDLEKQEAAAAAASAATAALPTVGAADPTENLSNNNNNNNNNNADVLLVHRKKSQNNNNNNKPKATAAPSPKQYRQWMILGPFEWGYCHNSKKPKPPRSHYDHVTQRLVLNLDHYCPWMFNAIGYFNYRYFVNFLIFCWMGMFYGVILSWEPFFLSQTREGRRFGFREREQNHRLDRTKPMMPHHDEHMLITLGFMLCAAVGLAVFILMVFHIFLILTAQTTIEFHGNCSHFNFGNCWSSYLSYCCSCCCCGNKNNKNNNNKYQFFRNPYDEGFRKNWKRVYGDGFWLWAILIPSAREPEYLPVPIPGKDTRRKKVTTKENKKPKEEFPFEKTEIEV